MEKRETSINPNDLRRLSHALLVSEIRPIKNLLLNLCQNFFILYFDLKQEFKVCPRVNELSDASSQRDLLVMLFYRC